jgi:hypothetical protein
VTTLETLLCFFDGYGGSSKVSKSSARGASCPCCRPDPFFQEPPEDDGLDVDRYFGDKHLEDLTLKTYDSLGLDVRDAMARSTLLLVSEPGNGRALAWTSDIGPHWCPEPFTNLVDCERLWNQAVN